jgi:hypothetical protein
MTERSSIVETVAGAPTEPPSEARSSPHPAQPQASQAPLAAVVCTISAPPPLPIAAAADSALAGAISPLPQGAVEVTAQGDQPNESSDPPEDWWLLLPSWLSSMVVHLALVLLLALLTFTGSGSGGLDDLVVSVDHDSPTGSVEELESILMQSTDELEDTARPPAPDLTESPKVATLAGAIGLVRPETPKGDTDVAPPGGAAAAESAGGGNALELRLDEALRAQLVRDGGGTEDSEKAVKRALQWLAEHQNYDGSWTFEHQKSPKCHGACNDPGFTPGKIAATALALLPFLGTGQTQLEGPYKRNIDLGLRFLVRSTHRQGDLGSLYEQGGQMYGHGLAAIVLCEAYGMTHDPMLADTAQAVVNFIAEAQDPDGGGWRYLPRQPGDTSVVGWQLMALKSAQMAYLRVPPGTMRKAGYFLDRVQTDRGAVYGYQGPERGRPATTAIGLLCRMYLGWTHDQPALARGVQILSALGPSTDKSRVRNNMYYNYYATQVMHHFGGSDWKRWNEVMREYLIETQSTKGHETGSWFFEGHDHGSPAGGRLYCTAMAAMTLEVYYRYMPLYRPQSTEVLPGQQ